VEDEVDALEQGVIGRVRQSGGDLNHDALFDQEP
jgi:hypothetical protein